MNLVGDVLKASTSPVLVLLADSSVDLFVGRKVAVKLEFTEALVMSMQFMFI